MNCPCLFFAPLPVGLRVVKQGAGHFPGLLQGAGLFGQNVELFADLLIVDDQAPATLLAAFVKDLLHHLLAKVGEGRALPDLGEPLVADVIHFIEFIEGDTGRDRTVGPDPDVHPRKIADRGEEPTLVGAFHVTLVDLGALALLN